jgi:hypothetical protein
LITRQLYFNNTSNINNIFTAKRNKEYWKHVYNLVKYVNQDELYILAFIADFFHNKSEYLYKIYTSTYTGISYFENDFKKNLINNEIHLIAFSLPS